MYTIEQADYREFMKSLDDESVDLICTDPPYASLEKHRAKGTTTRLKQSKASSNMWFPVLQNNELVQLFTEAYRVLKAPAHMYVFCDWETAVVFNQMALDTGFQVWTPVVWDYCIHRDTPVMTNRGAIKASEVTNDHQVYTPDGKLVDVLATRRVCSGTLKIKLDDNSELIVSPEHRFKVGDDLVEARYLNIGDCLAVSKVNLPEQRYLYVDDIIPDEERICELDIPDETKCFWCDKQFDSKRATAAHQARFCSEARSKDSMARELGVRVKRFMRWFDDRAIPYSWVKQLGLEHRVTSRKRLYLQNDKQLWYPEKIELDYHLGKLIGLFAGNGSFHTTAGITIAFNSRDKSLHYNVGRIVRRFGMKASVAYDVHTNRATVNVGYKLAAYIVSHFIEGKATTKYFKPSVYEAPDCFRQGVFDGLLDSDGYWSHKENRETVNLSSLDLSMFVYRHAAENLSRPSIRRYENDHAGGWRVDFDPFVKRRSMSVVSIEQSAVGDLVDIAIDDPEQLYLLGNGIVTHNCNIGMGYHYRMRYQLIMFLEKRKGTKGRKLNDLSIPNVLVCKRVKAKNAYPTQKPVALIETLIKQSTDKFDTVVDPFCGSGSTGVAAFKTCRRFVGNDAQGVAVELARRRLKKIDDSIDKTPTITIDDTPIDKTQPVRKFRVPWGP